MGSQSINFQMGVVVVVGDRERGLCGRGEKGGGKRRRGRGGGKEEEKRGDPSYASVTLSLGLPWR